MKNTGFLSSQDKEFLYLQLTSIPIFFGFIKLAGSLSITNNQIFIWNIIVFAFVIGTLILTMGDKVLRKYQKEYLPRLGSSIIVSSEFILIGNGLDYFTRAISGNIFSYSGLVVALIGLYIFSFMLATLFFEFGKTFIEV